MVDPAVSWTSDGTAWALTNGVKVSTGAVVVRAYKSTGGNGAWTFDSLVSGTQTGTDKPTLWVDRSSTSTKDNMYAIWHSGATAVVNVRKGPSGTWGTPLSVSGSETTTTADGGDIKTNGFGDVFAFWPDAGGQTLRIAKSTDGGATFGALGATPVKIASTNGSFTIKVPAQATRTTSGGGTIGALIYVTGGAYRTATQDLVFACWHDLAGGTGCSSPSDAPGTVVTSKCKTRIWFARSLDGGKTWQTASKINDQSGLNDQFFPRLAVDDLTGNLMVVYYDTVNDPSRVKTDIWMQYSTDGGATWSGATRVTTAQTDELTGAQDNSQQYGDYIGMSSGGGRYFACWTDRRSGGDEQIFGAPLAIPSMNFVFGKSTFSQDEVSPGQVINPAYYINVAGFTNESLGFNSSSDLNNQPGNIPVIAVSVDASLNPTLSSSQISTISANLPNLNISFGPLPILADDNTLNQELQSFFYPYSINFPSNPAFSNLYGSLNTDQFVFVTLSASFTVGNITLTAKALLELTKGEDPYFQNLDKTNPKAFPFWLSYDLRFFKATPTQSHQLFSVSNPTGAGDCIRYIQSVLSNLNTPDQITNGDTFDNALTQDEEQSALEFLPADNGGNPTFNFAVARVRVFSNASVTIGPVRVFFRLFPVQSASTTFVEVGTAQGAYRWGTDGSAGHKIALIGVGTDQNGHLEWTTVPCFATARVNLAPSNLAMNGQHDDPNTRTIATNTGQEVDAFFGCWLDINQQGQSGPPNLPAQLILPATPPAAQSQWDGPFSGALVSINELITHGLHQCLIAEIRFDDTPTPPGANAADSDKLAQRNIAWLDAPNPGQDASRVAAHPFEVKASSAAVDEVDEMLLLWGATPVGSAASFYLPAVPAADVITLANEMHPGHRLSVIDANTIGCPVGDATLIPIPKGVGSFAGLLTVDLPPGIRRGERYDVVVRQITKATATPYQPPPIGTVEATATVPGLPFSWRKTNGTFQATITISTKEKLLFPEERLLAWLKWKLDVVPKTLRFYPVLQRYLGVIIGRVGGLGGNPGKILPSPSGNVPGHPLPHPRPPHHRPDIIEFTGKVVALVYDRFGDFDGFKLLTEHGHEHEFRGREPAIEALVKGAWIERSVISVHVDEHRREFPTSIVLRRYH